MIENNINDLHLSYLLTQVNKIADREGFASDTISYNSPFAYCYDKEKYIPIYDSYQKVSTLNNPYITLYPDSIFLYNKTNSERVEKKKKIKIEVLVF
jgi:hypothetical protein